MNEEAMAAGMDDVCEFINMEFSSNLIWLLGTQCANNKDQP